MIFGPLGSFQQEYTSAAINITAYGYTNVTSSPPTPTPLYGKNGGNAVGEVGLGLELFPEFEIGPLQYIQLDLYDFAQTVGLGMCGSGANVPFIQIGSVQVGEGANLYGSIDPGLPVGDSGMHLLPPSPIINPPSSPFPTPIIMIPIPNWNLFVNMTYRYLTIQGVSTIVDGVPTPGNVLLNRIWFSLASPCP